MTEQITNPELLSLGKLSRTPCPAETVTDKVSKNITLMPAREYRTFKDGPDADTWYLILKKGVSAEISASIDRRAPAPAYEDTGMYVFIPPKCPQSAVDRVVVDLEGAGYSCMFEEVKTEKGRTVKLFFDPV